MRLSYSDLFKANPKTLSRRFTFVVAVSVSFALISILVSPFCFRRVEAIQYPDVSSKPTEIGSAIDYASNMGYLVGASDGKFYPDEPTNRLDYAKAVVLLFDHGSEGVDKGIKFTDLGKDDPAFLYANLAVKHGFLSEYPDGTFRVRESVNTADALAGLIRGLGLLEQVQHINNLFPEGPPYRGSLVVAFDLHLKFRDSRVLPANPYPRGEMAFSCKQVDELESWRLSYVRDVFNWYECQMPLTGPQRTKALKSAFDKIGYPYVWGGESDAEGGYDCSGLTYYVLSSVLGYCMKRTADEQSRDQRYETVSRGSLLPGDPVFFFKDASDPSYVGHAGLYVGHDLFIHSTGSNAGVSVDALRGYWEQNFAWGKRVISEGEPISFDTYILLMNPGKDEVEAELTYMLLDGRKLKDRVRIPPESRRTVRIDDKLYSQDVSTIVRSSKGALIAERAMYFKYKGYASGGHASVGAVTPSRDIFFPEGCTAYGFDTYMLVQNPAEHEADVTFSFMKNDGSVKDVHVKISPSSRYTLCVDSLEGMDNCEFSTYVSSDVPLIAERSMYFSGSRDGGHNSSGINVASNDWYFAEGYTGDEFDTYFLVQNPTGSKANLTLTLMGEKGARKNFSFVALPHSRKTIHADDLKGFTKSSFAALIHSDKAPVVAERAMYFKYKGISDGHAAPGTPYPCKKWYLAEGYTAEGFDTFVLIANPCDVDADVSCVFMTATGKRVKKNFKVKGKSRYTIHVDDIEGLGEEEVSALIESKSDILVERSMYFTYRGIGGGSCVGGAQAPADTWYFAEGYTGY
ncbi:MAG: NlpC/P60 family protein [Actinomycetota bacterium]|nr:NlpC/P60 family protein [Actinomycetota bacterium]